MLVRIKTHPGAKKEKVIQKTEDNLEIWLKEKPIMNQANEALMYVLSDFFKISKSKIRLVRGAKTRNKIFEISIK